MNKFNAYNINLISCEVSFKNIIEKLQLWCVFFYNSTYIGFKVRIKCSLHFLCRYCYGILFYYYIPLKNYFRAVV